MPNSNITKHALVTAFRELLENEPFSKISVSEICKKCEMNRKSFYYHFRDKYDLVNWIYYTEFVSIAKQKEYTLGWDLLEDLCKYFYDNRDFYKKIFMVNGQNSFSDYFHDVVDMILKNLMVKIYSDDDPIEFFVDFYSDAFFCAIKRWLLSKDCIPADAFVNLLKKCLLGTSNEIIKGLKEE